MSIVFRYVRSEYQKKRQDDNRLLNIEEKN